MSGRAAEVSAKYREGQIGARDVCSLTNIAPVNLRRVRRSCHNPARVSPITLHYCPHSRNPMTIMRGECERQEEQGKFRELGETMA